MIHVPLHAPARSMISMMIRINTFIATHPLLPLGAQLELQRKAAAERAAGELELLQQRLRAVESEKREAESRLTLMATKLV